MGLYNKFILPHIIDWTCKQKPNRRQREKVIPLAAGNVLEIGIGSGLNLPFYDRGNVKSLMAIDPATEIWDKNVVDTHSMGFEFDFVKAVAENIPADNNAFDTVVITYTLCSIPDTRAALDEIKRVLDCILNLGFAISYDQMNDQIIAGLEEFREHLGGKLTIMLLESLGKGFEVHEMDNALVLEAINYMNSYSNQKVSL